MKTSERLMRLIQSDDLNRAEISERTAISQNRISEIIHGASPTLQEVMRIKEAFNISLEWLMEDELSTRQSYGFRLVGPEVEAGFAKDHTNPEILSKMEAYYLPGFTESDNLLFKVSGDSMQPVIADGDYLVCRKIDDPKRMASGSVAVVLVKGSLMVKRVERQKEFWLLKSDNHEADGLRVSPRQIKAMWEVIGKVTRAFLESSKQGFLQKVQLQENLQLLRADLQECHLSFSQVRQTLETKSR